MGSQQIISCEVETEMLRTCKSDQIWDSEDLQMSILQLSSW